jgi:hypothetical protein
MLACLFVAIAWGKRTDDVVVMKNGDRFTGEIKKLDQGRLIFKAGYMADAMHLDWTNVDHLESKDQFNVSLTSGEIHTGQITQARDAATDLSSFLIREDNNDIRVTPQEVVLITPMEDSVWKQLTGSVDYGFSFTSGENVTQSSFSADVYYRAERWSLQATGTSVFNTQSGSESSGRNTMNTLYARYLTERWFAGAMSDLLSSKQQELTLRTTLGGGLGRVIVRRSRTSLVLLSGINFSREDYSPESGNKTRVNNAEALFYVKYRMFRFSNTQVDLDFYAFPNLTRFGRVRTGLQTSLKFEIFRNFFWKFSLYENFDSDPPITAPRNDFGTSMSVGWKF